MITLFNVKMITNMIILIKIIKMITLSNTILIILIMMYEDICVCVRFVKVISWRLRLYRQRAPIGRIGANRASTNHSSAGDWEFGQSRLG